ncbi:uncharacterized protein FOMMEDRAFT_165272 [Fomitiporia mediterranea MF3/22]|uniref:uncharacterized protein n=1 Tax=Fomitiporia mediterranea (strain MF3/22) TaxID=694068 RepID=UPI00044081E7|nr:uncharacterized protein FOMMEDRAFT_165272 [Fomitiporia mediterranea MF3/22]EJD06485.1 hypothetical protein FOMMEDRAFT_165272 [Fomitiporia mediterranea MF3/22]
MSSCNASPALSSLSDYRRYGRQMIIDGLGLPAQVKLQNASVLVVGAGGLGCPTLQYLCAAGVGRLGIVDHDVVELSNLQRQVLHSEATIGIPKVESAAQALKKLNSTTRIDEHNTALSPSNAESILSQYEVIIDCTDNAPVRYLLSDTCVRLNRPLVSGAAQRLDGQLCVYNLPLPFEQNEHKNNNGGAPERGPCYRCLFPRPPAPEMSGSCEETGILGAVTGVIGSLQALEAIKIIAGLHDGKPSLLVYSALASPPFRSVKLRTRRKNCPACGDEGERIGKISELDYITFCGGPRPNWVQRGLVVNNSRRRISANELNQRIQSQSNSRSIRILDVRSPVEFGICHLPSSQNTPLSEIVASPTSYTSYTSYNYNGRKSPTKSSVSNEANEDGETQETQEEKPLTVFVCRLGNDSQIAADALRDTSSGGEDTNEIVEEIVDLIGGLRSWAAEVDPEFPVY